MLPEEVIDRQVAGHPVVALLGVRKGHGVGPSPAERLDEPLSFTVCSGRVGLGAVTARKDDAAAAVQAAIVNVAELSAVSGAGGLIQTTSG